MNAINDSNMCPIEWISKIIRIRKCILSRGCSKKNVEETNRIIGKINKWMEFYSPTKNQMAKYIKRHSSDIQFLIPGANSGCFDRLNAEFQAIIESSK